MTNSKVVSELLNIEKKYSDYLKSDGNSLSNELIQSGLVNLSMFHSNFIYFHREAGLDMQAESEVVIELKKFEKYIKSKADLNKMYGSNTKYGRAYNCFMNDIFKLSESVNGNNGTLLTTLVNKYENYTDSKVMVILGYSSWMNSIEYIDKLKLRLPDPNDINSVLLIQYIFQCISDDLLSEFGSAMGVENKDRYFNSEDVKQLKEDILNKYGYDTYGCGITRIIMDANIYKFLLEVMPDYSDIKKCYDTWPFKGSLLELIDSKLNTFNFCNEVLGKMRLMGMVEYKNFEIKEAAAMLLLKQLIKMKLKDKQR